MFRQWAWGLGGLRVLGLTAFTVQGWSFDVEEPRLEPLIRHDLGFRGLGFRGLGD